MADLEYLQSKNVDSKFLFEKKRRIDDQNYQIDDQVWVAKPIPNMLLKDILDFIQ